jgi:hypothetical protein
LRGLSGEEVFQGITGSSLEVSRSSSDKPRLGKGNKNRDILRSFDLPLPSSLFSKLPTSNFHHLSSKIPRILSPSSQSPPIKLPAYLATFIDIPSHILTSHYTTNKPVTRSHAIKSENAIKTFEFFKSLFVFFPLSSRDSFQSQF